MKYNEKPFDIYWFSGTGNSLAIAIEIKNNLTKLGYKANLFPLDRTNPLDVDKHSFIGFVVPVAGQSTYPFIWEFVENLPETNSTPLFFIDTMGSYSGGILGPVKSIVKRKGYTPVAAKEILMPNNFQKRKSYPEREKKIIEKGKASASEFCKRLINGKGHWFDIPGYSRFLSIFYRYRSFVGFWKKVFPFFIDQDKCNGCGICIKLCPEKSLIMNEKKNIPLRNEKCSLCNRCFAFCPSNAIQIGNRKAVHYRALSLKELLRYLKLEYKE